MGRPKKIKEVVVANPQSASAPVYTFDKTPFLNPGEPIGCGSGSTVEVKTEETVISPEVANDVIKRLGKDTVVTSQDLEDGIKRIGEAADNMAKSTEALTNIIKSVPNNIPPKTFSRNEHGLLNDVGYTFDESGYVNWRAMVDPKFLVPNSEKTTEKDVSKLADDQLIILLAGLKKLAQIRGYENVSFTPITATSDFVSVVCRIEWISNYETENRAIAFESCADAGVGNTHSLAQRYLTAIAENRAFARCVRNFLQINIVSKEEVGAVYANVAASTSTEAWATLQEKMHSKSIGFAVILELLQKEGYEKMDKIRTIEDVPPLKCFELIEKIKNL